MKDIELLLSLPEVNMFFENKRFSITKIASLVAVALAAPTAMAEEEHHHDHDEYERISVFGKKKSYTAENSSAMKMNLSQLETPGTISIYDQELVDAQRATTLAQLLKNDASVSTGNSRRNRERFYMRGFVLEPDQSYLRDGQFHLARYTMPIELYERIEVLKGPSALLYGKSTPGGMINMVTKKASSDFHVNAQQEFGSFGFMNSMVDVGGALNEDETIRSRVILSRTSQDGWRKYKDGSFASTESLVGAIMLEADLGEDTTISFNWDRANDDGSHEMGPQHVKNKDTGKFELVGKRDYIWDMPWSHRSSDVENIGFTLNSELNEYWSISTGYNRQTHERQTTESLFGKVQGLDPETGDYQLRGRDTYEQFEVNTAFFDFKGDFEIGTVNHRLLIGSNIVDYDRQGKQALTKIADKVNINDDIIIDRPDALDYRLGKDLEHVQRRTYGFYAQDLIEFNEQWHALVGVRYDREETKHGVEDNILPKFALMYHPTENTTVYGTYSQSFEPKDPVMNTDDKNYGKKLDAELGELYELGAKAELLDGGLFVSAAIFQIEKNNKVVTDKSNDIPVTTQAGALKHRGFELSAEGKLTDELSILSSYMYLDATITKDPKFAGKFTKDTAKHTFSTWANYSLTEDSNFHVGAVYVGERFGDTPNEFKKDAYVKVDVGYQHRFDLGDAHEGILRINVDNALDADYLKGGCMNSAMFGDERSVKASFQFNF